METSSIRASEITRDWYLVDAENQTLGRLASKIAQILRGKSKPYFTPHMDMGDFVVVINAENEDLGSCGLVQINLKDYTFSKIINLSIHGPEIYSVLDVKCCLPSIEHRPSSFAFFEAAKTFFQRLI